MAFTMEFSWTEIGEWGKVYGKSDIQETSEEWWWVASVIDLLLSHIQHVV